MHWGGSTTKAVIKPQYHNKHAVQMCSKHADSISFAPHLKRLPEHRGVSFLMLLRQLCTDFYDYSNLLLSFTMAKEWNRAKYPSTDKWIKEMWLTYAIVY